MHKKLQAARVEKKQVNPIKVFDEFNAGKNRRSDLSVPECLKSCQSASAEELPLPTMEINQQSAKQIHK